MTSQTTRFAAALACAAFVLSACGGGNDSSAVLEGLDDPQEASQADDSSSGADDAPGDEPGEPGGIMPEPDEPLAMNTIRIGSQVWNRTLPMTSGQCYLYEDDGSLPTSANVWGTLEGDDDIRFSARFKQDGTFESEVVDQEHFYWIAGSRSPELDDLTIELDFEQLIVEGSGTYYNILTGEQAEGSFLFQCEPEDQ